MRVLDPAAALLGEGPVWIAEENALYWVDIKGRQLNRYDMTDDAVTRWLMPAQLCWVIARRHASGFIAGLGKAIGVLHMSEPPVFEAKLDVEAELPGNRLNDAKADGAGNIWLGTMDDTERRPDGALYALGADFSLRREDSGYVVANGPAFSPDGVTLYHTDSAARTVYRFRRRADGGLAEREVFVCFQPEDGYPDGMTVDAQGGVWVAHWGGGRVTRFLPDGTRDRAIELPVSQVTSCAFGGKRLDRLFVTSAAAGLSAAARAAEPLAGALFELDPGVVGLLPGRFAG
ncbi:SMP-30/gluconolactonase/LRE family protein [Acidocella sp.]|uniref:SMP-30/gluconolactonase/LRE family protein n=1 Tax=Acidocella sp. TaxID=50710 RepID=UPI0025C0CF71|nr:SMP-30/gluconolactonase/LRE family protein [Acidocella sp.]